MAGHRVTPPGVVKERQVLTELDLSLSFLRAWNRAYQRYRLRRYYPTSRFRRPIMTPTQVIASLKQQLAQTQTLLEQEKLRREAAETMIRVRLKKGTAAARDGVPCRCRTIF